MRRPPSDPINPCARAHDLTGGDHVRGKTRRSLVLLLCALCALSAVAFVATANAAKKSHKVKMTVTKPCPQKGTKICATYGGKPFGTCKMTGTLTIPTSSQTWKCKNGKIKLTAVGTTGAANDAAGTWKMKGGTGKYKHISGSGKFHGKLSTGVFTYRGTVKY
jgi:hypothetical protein